MEERHGRPQGAACAAGAWRKAVCGAAVALGLLGPVRGIAACKLGAIEMPVTMVGSRAIAKVAINGTEVPLMVDTGAFYSFLTDATAAQLHLTLDRAPRGLSVHGLTGSVDAHVTTVKRLQLPRGEIPDVDFIVGGNEPGSGAMGLIGRNLLTFADTEYDLAHGMIRFMFPDGDCGDRNMAYWAPVGSPASELELRREARTPLSAIKARARLNGKDVSVVFDTGASSVVSLDAARRAGVAQDGMTPDGVMHGLGRGEAKAWIASFDKFELAGEAIGNSRLRVADFEFDDVDMLLGIDFFLSHRLYVSKAQRRMYFTYNGGAVFALNKAEPPAPPASGASAAEPADELADAASYARRGAASAARRDFTRALADFDRAVELAPEVADTYTRRGMVHLMLEQFPEAASDYDAALRLDPAQPEARLQRVLMRVARNDRAGALDDLQALDRELAPQANERREMAWVYEQLDLPDRELPQLDQWIAAHPKEVDLDDVLNTRCWARVLLAAELDKALADCDRIVDRQPKKAAFLDSRAWVRLRRGELRDALDDYDRAIKLQPQGAWSLYGRGIARTRLGDAAQGRADIEAARKLQPSIDALAGRHGMGADPVPVSQASPAP